MQGLVTVTTVMFHCSGVFSCMPYAPTDLREYIRRNVTWTTNRLVEIDTADQRDTECE